MPLSSQRSVWQRWLTGGGRTGGREVMVCDGSSKPAADRCEDGDDRVFDLGFWQVA
jgi:hypothetical protein